MSLGLWEHRGATWQKPPTNGTASYAAVENLGTREGPTLELWAPATEWLRCSPGIWKCCSCCLGPARRSCARCWAPVPLKSRPVPPLCLVGEPVKVHLPQPRCSHLYNADRNLSCQVCVRLQWENPRKGSAGLILLRHPFLGLTMFCGFWFVELCSQILKHFLLPVRRLTVFMVFIGC